MANIGNLAIKLTVNSVDFHRELEKVVDGLKEVAAEAGKLGGLGQLLGLGGGVVAIGGWLESTKEAALQTSKLATELGVSPDELSKWQYAANHSQVSTEEFSGALLKFSRALGGAESQVTGTSVAFEKFGLNAKELASKGLLGAFEQTLTKISQIQDPTLRAAEAFAVFGRKGQALLAMAAEGPEGLRKLREEAAGLSESMQASAHAAHEAQTEIGNWLTKVGQTVLVGARAIAHLGNWKELADKDIDAAKAAGIARMQGGTGAGAKVQAANEAQRIKQFQEAMDAMARTMIQLEGGATEAHQKMLELAKTPEEKAHMKFRMGEEDVAKVRAGLASPLEKFNQEVRKLENLKKAGLNLEDFNKAVKKLAETAAAGLVTKTPGQEFAEQMKKIKDLEKGGVGFDAKTAKAQAFEKLMQAQGLQPPAGVAPVLAGSAADLSMSAKLANADPMLDLKALIQKGLDDAAERDNAKLAEMQKIGAALEEALR